MRNISLIPTPSHLHANIHTLLVFLPVGRSGQFGDVMVMSMDMGLNIHGCGLNFLDAHRSLTMLGTQSAFSSFARAHSLRSVYKGLVQSSQVWTSRVKGWGYWLNVCRWTWLRVQADQPRTLGKESVQCASNHMHVTSPNQPDLPAFWMVKNKCLHVSRKVC